MEDIPLTPEQIAQIEAIKAMENTTPEQIPAPTDELPQSIPTEHGLGVSIQPDHPVHTD